jgi:hypothetical protein
MRKEKRKMKKILILSMIVTALTGCSEHIVDNTRFHNVGEDFVKVGNGHYRIVYDTETNVMYLASTTGGLSVMYDEHGDVLLYDKEIKK